MRLNPEQRVVHCEDGDISYLLTRKPVKNVNLSRKNSDIFFRDYQGMRKRKSCFKLFLKDM